jgi:hypothetical protein
VSVSASLTEQIESLTSAMTATQLAKLLAMDRASVYRAAKSGALPSFLIGTCVRFDPKQIAACLRERGAL